MRFQKLVLLIISFFTVVSFVNGQERSDASAFMTAMFRKKTVEWQEAYNAKDIAKLKQFYSDDAEYIASDISSLAVKGRENVIAWFKKVTDNNSHMDSIEIIKLDISDGLATVYSKFRMTDNGVSRSGRNIMVLKRDGIKWLIILHMVVEDNQ